MAIFWTIFTVAIIVVVGLFIFSQMFAVRRTSSALTFEQSRLTTIIDNLEEGVIAYDENFTILVFNRAAEKIFSIPAHDVINQSFTVKIREGLPARLRPLLVILFPALATTIIRRSELGMFPQIIDVSFEDPSLELRVTTNKISDASGETLGFIKLIHDRTRELTLVHEKSEFITVASHQLRTPLTGASWALENLKKENLTPSARELVENMMGAVNRMMKITNDLLDVAKIEEGRFGYQFTEFDLTSFIEGALAQAKPVADAYDIRLFFEKPKEGSLKITADTGKLGMVLANLLDNALKYNVVNGEVTVKLEKIPNQSYIKISIRDSGIGIKKEETSKVFTKFFRGENAVKASVEGTGLGLYIVKNIIRRLGGDIAFQSTLNRGTTIAFTLPTNQSLIPAKEFAGEE